MSDVNKLAQVLTSSTANWHKEGFTDSDSNGDLTEGFVEEIVVGVKEENKVGVDGVFEEK